MLETLPDWAFCNLVTFSLFAVCGGAEYLVARARGLKIYGFHESLANIFVLVFFAAACALWTGLVTMPIYNFLHSLAPWRLMEGWQRSLKSVPWWDYLLLFLLDDFCFYVYHRTMHRSRFGWAMHETHHSANYFNITAAAREPWTSVLVAFVFWSPLALIGFSPRAIVFQQWLNLSYQLLVHTPVVGRLGWLELILNTPSHHRVHHGTNSHYIDKNFGGILIIWDKLFGTFEPEGVAPDYGIQPKLTSCSPWVISFNGFRQYFASSPAQANTDLLRTHPINESSAHQVIQIKAERQIERESDIQRDHLRDGVGN